MEVRVLLAGAVEPGSRVGFEPEVLWPKLCMLAGEHEHRPTAAGSQRMCNRGHFDGFRPGADHQPDVGGTQYSP
jgi:hypothetical protein